ncbi:UDP-N-acetylmuramoyl-L-alanyl-D-glutamate--2,6-diaminopimelate ligase [bacterium]|nr:UDP-N-acetylmuramoyl-L-alanyl-D-glutamate--2,6-diaminopimelate ligase [bacterium]
MPFKMRNKEIPLKVLVEAIGGEVSFDMKNTYVKGLSSDSRKVEPGILFFAVSGESVDGHFYVPEAFERGAVAVVVERALDPEARVICVPDTRIALAKAAREFYQKPEEKIAIAGVTGTNGKTTTTHMIKTVASSCDEKWGVIGTLGYSYGEKYSPLLFTTPDSVTIYKILSEMVEDGLSGVAMEISSHGIAQQRCWGLMFKAIGFTNLTQDHLDYHKDMESYFDIKSRIFEEAELDSISVICVDDDYGKRLSETTRSSEVISYGIQTQADIVARNIICSSDKTNYILDSPVGTIEVELRIPGYFNVYNSLCAVGIGLANGWSLEAIARGLSEFKGVLGRLQRIFGNQNFSIYIDYSHTPDALKNAIHSCRQIATGKVITVFGAGGDRDKSKRPKMGAVAGNMSDLIIITSDNPRSENPYSIIEQVSQGVPESAKKHLIENRKEAIYFALSIAKPGDVVLIAGKGHEDYQIIGNTKRHFDDCEIAEEWLIMNGLKD